MTLRHLIASIFCALLCVGPAAAAYTAPTFRLSHAGSQAGFTNSATVTVTVTYPLKTHTGTLWCITQDSTLQYCQSKSAWTSKPAQFTLTGGDGLNTVYLEYKYGGTVSPPGEAQITLDLQPPTVTLSEPTGLPGALPGGFQQAISTSSQFITGSVSDAVSTDPVTVTLNACTQAEVCTPVSTISAPASPFVWTWPSSDVFSGTTYIQIDAVNAAGGTSSTAVPNPATVFSVFSQANLLTCSATACPTLAGPLTSAQYMPNDAPSQAVDGATFTGYADPSMRRDPAVGSANPNNPNGTQLWMLYSHPEVQQNTTFGTASEMVEIHLASSQDSGNTWNAWCAPQPCTQETPIWPSYHWQPIPGQQQEQYSSHEVANFWPYSSDNVNWNWYAVHLMYFVQPPQGILNGIDDNGCLITTVASTPYVLGLGWTGIGQAPPSSCTAPLPANNWAISYSALTAAAGSHAPTGFSCVWGEPAIMVQSGVAYLAVSCFNSNLFSDGYFIFANTLDSSGGLSGSWGYYGGPFHASNVTKLTPKAQFVTEFDWAERSDGSLVAIVSPASIANHVETQYGCVALNFTLTGGFGNIVIAVNDTDPLEGTGPNACTYEPTSNTGMLIVRKLESGANYTAWSMTATGLMP